MSTGNYSTIGAIAGAALMPANPLMGMQIGATLGALVDGLTARDQHRFGDNHFSPVSYGTSIPIIMGAGRIDCPIPWAARQPDGTYTVLADRGKKGQTVTHAYGTFAGMLGQTAFVFDDGTTAEFPVVIDRLWAADKRTYESSSASPIAAWASGTTYNIGDYVKGSDNNLYYATQNSNTNHDPTNASNQPIWWILSSSTQNWDMEVHPGGGESALTQLVSSIIATHDGVDKTSAMRTLTYFVVNNYDTIDIGNQIPQALSAEYHSVSPITYADVLGVLARLCSLKTADYDFSAASKTCTGFQLNNRVTGAQAMANIISLNGWDIAQIDGVIKLKARGGDPVCTIPDSDLSCAVNGETLPDNITVEMLCDRSELHDSVTVMYYDTTAGYRRSGQRAIRNNAPTHNPLVIDSGLTLTPDEAAQMAGLMIDTEWLEAGAEYTIYLPGSYGYLTPTDVVMLTYEGTLTRFRIIRIELQQGLLKAVLVRDEVEILNQTATGTSTSPILPPTTIVPTFFRIASPAIDFTDQFATFPGVYVWAWGAPIIHFGNPIQYWKGCRVMLSFDEPGAAYASGTTYAIGDAVLSGGLRYVSLINSNTGNAPASHPLDWDPQTRVWTEAGSITNSSWTGVVDADALLTDIPEYNITAHTTIRHDEIEAQISPIELGAVNNGYQWALCGDEIIGVVNAGVTSIDLQELGPGLVRGLRGSPTNTHTVGEQFTMAYRVDQTQKFPVDAQYEGQTVYVQCLSPGQEIGDAIERSCVIGTPTSPWVNNPAPIDPASVTAGTPTYNGQAEVVEFTAVFGAIPPGAERLYWEYSTDAGSTWSSQVIGGTRYTPPSFTSGTMRARAKGFVPDGRTGAWVASTDTTYVAPATPQPAPVDPTSISISAPGYSGMTESLVFAPVVPTGTGPQSYEWQTSTNSGSTWTSSVFGQTLVKTFTSGNLRARVRAVTNAGSGAWVATSDQAYVAPTTGSVGHLVTREVPSGTINGSNATFTLANTPLAGTDTGELNGVDLQSGAGNDYTISGATITMLQVPQTGDRLLWTYYY